MRSLISKWHNVDERIPNHNEWCIVRCINSQENDEFYFMAHYWKNDGQWIFLDDEYDHEMQVTHWMDTPKIKFDIKYIMDEKNEHDS